MIERTIERTVERAVERTAQPVAASRGNRVRRRRAGWVRRVLGRVVDAWLLAIYLLPVMVLIAVCIIVCNAAHLLINVARPKRKA